MSDIPMSPPQKGQPLEPRRKAEQTAAESFVQSAPLHTAQESEPTKSEQKPWRVDTSMSVDELQVLAHKFSANIPIELVLRLDYLAQVKKPKTFGKKLSRNSLLVEALEQYTKSELKKLGHNSVD